MQHYASIKLSSSVNNNGCRERQPQHCFLVEKGQLVRCLGNAPPSTTISPNHVSKRTQRGKIYKATTEETARQCNWIKATRAAANTWQQRTKRSRSDLHRLKQLGTNNNRIPSLYCFVSSRCPSLSLPGLSAFALGTKETRPYLPRRDLLSSRHLYT